jgi:hypothetical protein
MIDIVGIPTLNAEVKSTCGIAGVVVPAGIGSGLTHILWRTRNLCPRPVSEGSTSRGQAKASECPIDPAKKSKAPAQKSGSLSFENNDVVDVALEDGYKAARWALVSARTRVVEIRDPWPAVRTVANCSGAGCRAYRVVPC